MKDHSSTHIKPPQLPLKVYQPIVANFYCCSLDVLVCSWRWFATASESLEEAEKYWRLH